VVLTQDLKRRAGRRLANGSAKELKVTELAKSAAVHSWSVQERLCGVAAVN
jgi:hypothetical protein